MNNIIFRYLPIFNQGAALGKKIDRGCFVVAKKVTLWGIYSHKVCFIKRSNLILYMSHKGFGVGAAGAMCANLVKKTTFNKQDKYTESFY